MDKNQTQTDYWTAYMVVNKHPIKTVTSPDSDYVADYARNDLHMWFEHYEQQNANIISFTESQDKISNEYHGKMVVQNYDDDLNPISVDEIETYSTFG